MRAPLMTVLQCLASICLLSCLPYVRPDQVEAVRRGLTRTQLEQRVGKPICEFQLSEEDGGAGTVLVYNIQVGTQMTGAFYPGVGGLPGMVVQGTAPVLDLQFYTLENDSLQFWGPVSAYHKASSEHIRMIGSALVVRYALSGCQ